MPFYEYECENCKFYTELLQKVTDAPLKKCPSCGKNTMKKLVSAPVFRLKGGGWYETDFKGDKENKRNLAVEKEPAAESASDSKPAASDAKADAKPAAESKPAEAKASDSGASSSGSRKAGSSRSAASASKSRAKPAAKSKSRPAPRKGK
jgi:putative FmdB family regulatory protein